MLAFIIPHLAVWNRRMHDVGKSGWFWLFGLLPIIGWIVILTYLLRSGDEGPNKYGDPDNGPYTPNDIRTKIEPETEIVSEDEEQVDA